MARAVLLIPPELLISPDRMVQYGKRHDESAPATIFPHFFPGNNLNSWGGTGFAHRSQDGRHQRKRGSFIFCGGSLFPFSLLTAGAACECETGCETSYLPEKGRTMNTLRRILTIGAFASLMLAAVPAEAKGPKLLLTAVMTPTAGSPAALKGKGKFDQNPSRSNFSAEAENLRAYNGQVASVYVNGTLAGTAPVALGQMKLELTDQRGGSVPVVKEGSKIEIVVNLKTILSGTFKVGK